MHKYLYSLTLLFLFCSHCLANQQVYQLTIPSSLTGNEGKNHFVESLLKHIFAAQGYKLALSYSDIPSNKVRTAKLLSQNNTIDLFWANARTDVTQQLSAIKIPIYNGYIGYRLLLINSNSISTLAKVSSLSQLATFTAVQKKDWLDYQILVANGLKVEGNLTFKAMFRATEQGLVDYFPRSILEIDRELIKFGSAKLAIEPSLLIVYPTASYFYVNKDNKKLAHIVNNGFNTILENGKYQRLFEQTFGEIINKHQLSDRQIIKLKNPFFSK